MNTIDYKEWNVRCSEITNFDNETRYGHRVRFIGTEKSKEQV